ncbi:MAG: amino acid permease [Acidobacteriia bacterium]|nr:amino acid permease [Terriglobia bacterium]
MSSANGSSGLVRGLGLAGAISLNVANMIGTGVFLKARVMTCNTDSPIRVLAVWFLAALLVLAGALAYGELAAMMPRAGGEYVFLRAAYGPRLAFLYGWTYIFVARCGSLAAQSVGAAIFLNMVTGGALERFSAFGFSGLQLSSVTVVALAGVINCLAVKHTGRLATISMAIKVGIVASIGIAVFAFAPGDWFHYTLSGASGACQGIPDSARGGLMGFGAAMIAALWGYQGWANLAPMIGEVRNPGRILPRAFVLSTLMVASIYLLANASYFYALTPAEVASVPASSSVATVALSRFLGSAVAAWMAAAMLFSSLGAIHTGMAPIMRMPYAMALDGLFFSVFRKVSPSGVPVRAALLIGSWSAILSLSGSYDKLTDYAIFALYFFYGLTAASVFVLRRTQPDADRPFRTWGYPVVPGLFVLVTIWLLLNTILTVPWQALSSLGLIALGLPFYSYWSRRSA